MPGCTPEQVSYAVRMLSVLSGYGLRPLVDQVATEHAMLPSLMLSGQQSRSVWAAKQHLFFLMTEDLGWSYRRVGEVFGVDHRSVMRAVNAHAARTERISA